MLWIALVVSARFHFSLATDAVRTIEVPVCEAGINYTLPHFHFCDRYFSCIEGFVHEGQCADGFAYEPFLGCIYAHFVNCTSRPHFQPAVSNGTCPHLNGIFPDVERGCQHFFECINGEAKPLDCSEGMIFDSGVRSCRNPNDAELVECFVPKQELLPPPVASEMTPTEVEVVESSEHEVFNINGVKFKCPEDDLYTFGDHSRYAFPGSCRFYVICWRSGKTTVNGCPHGTGFNPGSFTCEPIESLTNC